MTQAELGKRVGRYLGRAWSPQTVSAAEKGRRAFTALELMVLSTELDVPIHSLLSPAFSDGDGAIETPGGIPIPAERLLLERGNAAEPDLSGWSAVENAEFEALYGIQAAMRLRAANYRVWAIVQDLRDEAVEAGRDPYRDPMAQRLSAALVGVEDG